VVGAHPLGNGSNWRRLDCSSTPSASLILQLVLWPLQTALKTPSFGSMQVKALHSDSEPASQNFLS
jgi:hypothetical protein